MRHVFLMIGVLGILAGSLVRADEKQPLTIASWNIEWFFDNNSSDNVSELSKKMGAPTREDWDWRMDGVAKAISEMKPTILCLQEIENRKVLFFLMRKLKADYGLNYKIAYIEGEDYFTEQDVAILWQSGMVEYSRRELSTEDRESKKYYPVQKHIFGRFEWGEGAEKEGFTLVNLHLRATPDGTLFRQRQGALVRRWLEGETARGEQLVIMGDLNSEEHFDQTTNDHELGILRGLNTEDTKDDLRDLHEFLAPERRLTHIILKSFDRILVSPRMLTDEPDKKDLVFKKVSVPKEFVIRGKQDTDHMDIYWTIPPEERDVSDHWPVVAEFEWK